MPPRLRLSVSAAAMVLPKRYWIGMPSTTRGLLRRLKLSGKQVRRERRQDVLHGAVFVDVTRDAERRQLAHFLRARDRAAEDQNRQPPSSSLRIDRTSSTPGACGSRRSSTMRSMLVQIGADARQQLGGALRPRSPCDRRSRRAVRKRSRTNAVSSAIDDGLRGDRAARHPVACIAVLRAGVRYTRDRPAEQDSK